MHQGRSHGGDAADRSVRPPVRADSEGTAPLRRAPPALAGPDRLRDPAPLVLTRPAGAGAPDPAAAGARPPAALDPSRAGRIRRRPRAAGLVPPRRRSAAGPRSTHPA